MTDEAVIVAHDEVALDDAHGVEGDTDNNQERRPAQESRHFAREPQHVLQDGRKEGEHDKAAGAR